MCLIYVCLRRNDHNFSGLFVSGLEALFCVQLYAVCVWLLFSQTPGMTTIVFSRCARAFYTVEIG